MRSGVHLRWLFAVLLQSSLRGCLEDILLLTSPGKRELAFMCRNLLLASDIRNSLKLSLLLGFHLRPVVVLTKRKTTLALRLHALSAGLNFRGLASRIKHYNDPFK